MIRRKEMEQTNLDSGGCEACEMCCPMLHPFSVGIQVHRIWIESMLGAHAYLL